MMRVNGSQSGRPTCIDRALLIDCSNPIDRNRKLQQAAGVPHVWAAASASVSSLHTDGSSSSRSLAPAPAPGGAGGGGQVRSFSKFKGGSLREKGGGGAGGKGGKGGKGGAAVGGAGDEGVGVGGMEEELLTLDPAELELPPGTKTDSELCVGVVWWSGCSWCVGMNGLTP